VALNIHGYFDESGGEENFVIAGALAPLSVWEELSEDWQRVLDREGLAEFHAENCAHGVEDFADWSKERRESLYREFAEIIQAHNGIHGIGIALDVAAWKVMYSDLFPPRLPAVFDKPWLFAFGLVLMAAVQLCPDGEQIAFVFDEQREFKHQALEGYAVFKDGLLDGTAVPWAVASNLRTRLGPDLAFEDSCEHPPLQVADLLAYELLLRLRPRTPRQSWTRTIEKMEFAVALFTPKAVERVQAVKAALVTKGYDFASAVLDADKLADLVTEIGPGQPDLGPLADEPWWSMFTAPQDLPPGEW
jgi:hypothetical protein